MLQRVRATYESLRASLWFLPVLLVVLGAALALALVGLDEQLSRRWWKGFPLLNILLDVDSAGAAAMVQIIASSVITVAGVVFSITMVAFAQVAMQYTSRVLRTFMRDRINQWVLGSFLGIYVYCLLILRVLAQSRETASAPALSTLVAIGLAVVAVLILIGFIHHVTVMLQASHIVAAIGRESIRAIERHFETAFDESGVPQPGLASLRSDAADVANTEAARSDPLSVGVISVQAAGRFELRTAADGMLRSINRSALKHWAQDRAAEVHVVVRPGEFLVAGQPLAVIHSAVSFEPDALRALRATFDLAEQRTLEDDPAYGLRQLVDVALKALSPAVNETTTGVLCVDWIGASLVRAAAGCDPSARVYDSDGVLRVDGAHQTYVCLLDLGYDQIREAARNNVAVLDRQLALLIELARYRRADADAMAAMQRQLAAFTETLRDGQLPSAERARIQAQLVALEAALGAPGPAI